MEAPRPLQGGGDVAAPDPCDFAFAFTRLQSSPKSLKTLF